MGQQKRIQPLHRLDTGHDHLQKRFVKPGAVSVLELPQLSGTQGVQVVSLRLRSGLAHQDKELIAKNALLKSL
jgi:hypothetical protein